MRLRKSILEVHDMRYARLVATTLLGMLLCALPSSYLTAPVVRAAQVKPEKKEVRVWVNTNSSVYHCPGTRWYGKTKQGKYMSECRQSKAAIDQHTGRLAGQIASRANYHDGDNFRTWRDVAASPITRRASRP